MRRLVVLVLVGVMVLGIVSAVSAASHPPYFESVMSARTSR